MQEEDVESFLGIKSEHTHEHVDLQEARAEQAPIALSADILTSEANQEPSGKYFLKTSSSRYVGMYSASEIAEGLRASKFKPDWLATKCVDGQAHSEFHTEHQGPWASLATLFEKPREKVVTKSTQST